MLSAFNETRFLCWKQYYFLVLHSKYDYVCYPVYVNPNPYIIIMYIISI